MVIIEDLCQLLVIAITVSFFTREISLLISQPLFERKGFTRSQNSLLESVPFLSPFKIPFSPEGQGGALPPDEGLYQTNFF